MECGSQAAALTTAPQQQTAKQEPLCFFQPLTVDRKPLRVSRCSFTCELFDEAASDVADGDVAFLDALGVF